MLKTYACFTNSCKREWKNESAAQPENHNWNSESTI